MDRRTFLKTMGFTPISLSMLGETALFSGNEKYKKPNIIFIFSDDHAVQSISAYGSKINKTPHIDRLADEGVIFDRCFCGNSICAPSRAAVLTGKHSHMNGLMTNQNRFDGGQMTFPKLLQADGYQTAMIGKWHLKTDPTGFDHWEILTGQGHYYNPDFRTIAGSQRFTGYAMDITTDLALDWLKTGRDNTKPFLLMCHHKAPHRTWAPGPKHLTMYDDITIPEPPTLFDDYADRNSALKDNEMMIAKHLMYEYDLKIAGAQVKDALGRAFRNPELSRMTPEQRQVWDAVYEPKNKKFLQANLQGMELVRWMYEESFRMPFVVRWPAVIPSGLRTAALAQNIDFAPTFLTAAGVGIPADMQGESLMPLLQGKKPSDWRNSLYYHYYEKGEHNVPRHYGVRTDRYKLIHYYDIGEWELFDLQQDPQELMSVYDNPAYQKIQTQLHAELKRLRKLYQVPDEK